MKQLIILAVAIGVLLSPTIPALADGAEIDWFETWQDEEQRVAFDAPNLVALGDDLYAGTEISKDIHNTNSDQGWVVVGKVTYTGTLVGPDPDRP